VFRNLPNSCGNDSAMIRGTINIDNTIDGSRKLDLDKNWESAVIREAVPSVSSFIYDILSDSNKTLPCSTFNALSRRQRMKRPRISLRFSMADNDGDDNNDNSDELPSRRCGLTAFFLTNARRAPLCLLEWKLDLLLFPLFYLRLSGTGLNESTTFTSGVSRFRLKSPFHSELYLAVISHFCQATFPELFRVALFSCLVRVPKTSGISVV